MVASIILVSFPIRPTPWGGYFVVPNRNDLALLCCNRGSDLSTELRGTCRRCISHAHSVLISGRSHEGPAKNQFQKPFQLGFVLRFPEFHKYIRQIERVPSPLPVGL